jgi:hypothetical protein
MGSIGYFMLGSIWTIALMAGAISAYLWVNSKLRRGNDASPTIKPPQGATRSEQSGAVRAIKPEEIREEKEKGFINKMKSLIE